MPLLKRKPIEKESNTHEVLKDNQGVFYCKLSREIFVNYEEYFERIMLFNSTVWSCEVSGRPNLTYAEALESEKKHRKLIEAFPQELKGPVVYLANLTKRSAIGDMVDDVFNYANTRFFKGEVVSAIEPDTEQYVECEVIGFVTPNGTPNGTKEIKINPEDVKYRVKRLNSKSTVIWTCPVDQIRRKKKDNNHVFTKEKLKLFLKQCIEYNDIRMLTIKQEAHKKYITGASITGLASFFVGKQPSFDLSKVLADKKDKKDKKKKEEQKKVKENGVAVKAKTPKGKKAKDDQNSKQTSISQFMTKDGKEKVAKPKPSAADLEKAKKLAEEMNAKRKQKEAEEAERVKKLAEERERHRVEMLQLVQTTVKSMNAIKDDLELQDQRPLPPTKPLRTLLPDQYFADALMIQEFIYSYTEILEDKNKFRNGINLGIMERALLSREVAGPLSDILEVLLGTIFSLQIEELNEMSLEFEKAPIQFKDGTLKEKQEIIQAATASAFWSKRYMISNIAELPIDATTISELLRLHFLSSGARLTEAGTKWRFQERGGYQSTDDPGIILRMNHPHILEALATSTVYELPTNYIIIILKCLIDQILTYSSVRDAVEERIEKSTKARIAVRTLLSGERKREAILVAEKKELLEEVKKKVEVLEGTDEEKAAQKENIDKDLDNKVKRLEYVAEKEKKKFEEELEALRREIFDYQLFLGSDRAYRSYWLFESLPGLFIEQLPFGGECIENPVENIHGLAYCPPDKRYMFIKNMLHDKQRGEKEQQQNGSDKENKINNLLEKKPKSGDEATPVAVVVKEEPVNLSQKELLMCTGNQEDCPVHLENDPNRVVWSFLHTEEDLNALIESLNSRGLREKNLKEQLETQKELILYHIKNCPTDKLQVDDATIKEKIDQMADEKSKTFANANFNYPKGTELSAVMMNEIRENILDIEFRIETGMLGSLSVKDRLAWRKALTAGGYDMQCDHLQWGPVGQFYEGKKGETNGIVKNGTTNGNHEEAGEEDSDEESFTDIKYEDPGANLERKSSIKVKSENTSEATPEYKKQIHNFACALLQIAQGVDQKYLKPPFGSLKVEKKGNKDAANLKAKRNLNMWCVSLMNSINVSQLFLHYNVLYDAIKWTRSAQNAKCICRSSRDPDKLLLCDGCNIGRHIYCLKPKLTKVPEGDWFCSKCKPNQKEASPKKKRKVFKEESEEEQEDEEDEEENEESEQEGGAEEEDENDSDYENDQSMTNGNYANSALESSDEENLVCVRCNKPNRNLFSCSKCKRHYDTRCLGLTSKPTGKWSCPSCPDSRNRKRRHADSDDDFVQVAKTSRLSDAPKEKEGRRSSRRAAESSPLQQNQRLSSSRRNRASNDLLLDNVTLYKLLDDIGKHKYSWPFLRAVNQREVPDYYNVIKQPMDFAKIKSNLNTGKYSSNYEVMNDIQLIFSNCDLYNTNDSDIYQAGVTLETFVHQRSKELNLPFKPSDMISSTTSSDDPSSRRKRQRMSV